MKETYTKYVYHEEQEQQGEPGVCVSTFNAGYILTMEIRNEFTKIFYLSDAANSGKCMIRVVSEDTDLFVLL